MIGNYFHEKAAGLREPEFIGGEVDLRINIYRGQVDTNNAVINANGTKNGTDGILNVCFLTGKGYIDAKRNEQKIKF